MRTGFAGPFFIKPKLILKKNYQKLIFLIRP